MAIGNQGQKYRSAHDPYNGMEQPDIRPDFVARQDLSEAEQSAARTSNNSSRSNNNAVNRLRADEQNQRANRSFRNSVSGKKGIGGKRGFSSKFGKNGKGKNKKRFAPIALMISLIFGGGGLFYLTQTTLAPTLSNLYTNATDLQFTSYNSRNTRIFRYLMTGGNQLQIGIFGKRYTTFTPYMKSRLKKSGIEVGHIDANGNFTTSQLPYKTVLRYNNEIIDADAFQNKFASDVNFREAYYKAKRGRIAGFFDASADRYYKKKGATRDIFNRYKSTGDSKTDTDNFRKVVSDRVSGTDANINTVGRTKNEETNEDVVTKNGDDINTRNISGNTPEAKARTMVNNIAGKVSGIGVPVCSALRIANIAAVTVSAYKIYSSIAYFLSMMEPISKTLYGNGESSGINETLNFFTTETTSNVQYVNDDGSTVTKAVSGAPLQSSGAKLILGNTVSPASATQPYSIRDVMKAATTIAVSTGATNVICDGVMASSAIVSLVTNAIPGGALASFIVSAIAHTVGGIVITGVVSLVISAIIPYVAKVFTSNVFESYTGIPAGEFFTQGAANSNFRLATEGSAYMPADEEYIKQQNHETTVALAQEAAVDRNGRSPFDITSQNTFLGSLLSKFALLSNTNGPIGFLSNIATMVGKSLSVFNPSTSAYDDSISYTSNYHSCENDLSGTVCDMYDQEIVGMDYSVINLSPDDPTYQAVLKPNLDDNGNIKENSELAKFISFCTERESPWGVTDSNIMNSLQTDFGVIGNNLFLVSDVLDIINAGEDLANQGWGTGANCQMSKNNPRWDSEFKYYQLYVNDMRILSSMTDEKNSNPVIAYKEKYAEKHPIDTSFEGTLARISGQSKDDIAFLLEYARYSDQIAHYNPAERYAFSKDNIEPIDYNFATDQPESFISLIPQTESIFIDRRNYAV